MDKPEDKTNKKSIDYLNFYLPNKAALYDILDAHKKLYLPALHSRAITQEYLLSVAKNEVFTIYQNEIKIGKLCRPAVIAELIDILKDLTQNKPLGFDVVNTPNKNWLVNCIYTLNPNHSLFHPPRKVITRNFPKNFFNDIKFPLRKYKGKGLFKKTAEERDKIRILQNKKTLKKTNHRKVLKLGMELDILEKLIQIKQESKDIYIQDNQYKNIDANIATNNDNFDEITNIDTNENGNEITTQESYNTNNNNCLEVSIDQMLDLICK